MRRWEWRLWCGFGTFSLVLCLFCPAVLSNLEDRAVDFFAGSLSRPTTHPDLYAIRETDEDRNRPGKSGDWERSVTFDQSAKTVFQLYPSQPYSDHMRREFGKMTHLIFPITTRIILPGEHSKIVDHGDFSQYAARLDTIPDGVAPRMPTLGFPYAGWISFIDGVGLAQLTPDVDGVMRRFPTIVEYRGKNYFHVAVHAVLEDTAPVAWTGAGLVYKQRRIPTDQNGYFRPRPNRDVDVRILSASEYLDLLDSQALSPAGKIALYVDERGAYRQTFVLADGRRVSKTEALAFCIASVLDGHGLRPVPAVWSTALVLAFILPSALVGRWSSSMKGVLWLSGLLTGYSIMVILFLQSGLIVPILSAFLGIAVAILWGLTIRSLARGEDRSRLESAFGKYLSKPVLERLMGEGQSRLTGRRKRVTVLFADIRGFTSRAEKLPVEETVTLLNEFYQASVKAILEHGGTMDKLIGDATMAFWGDPLDQADHAHLALAAARQIRRSLTASGLGIQAGIGLETGDVVVGNLGSEVFISYTVLGDTVNLAARLEKAAAAGEILVGPGLAAEVGSSAALAAREPIKVKGKANPVAIYSA